MRCRNEIVFKTINWDFSLEIFDLNVKIEKLVPKYTKSDYPRHIFIEPNYIKHLL